MHGSSSPKRLIFIALAGAILIYAAIVFRSLTADEYHASKNSNIYHHSTCPAARRISPHNLITYDSPEAAAGDGRRPCKLCKPTSHPPHH